MATRMGFLGAPEQFDPSSDDWTLYSERFEHFVKANDIKDEQKLHLLLALVGAQTYRLLTNLVAPKKPGELTYDETKEKLRAHFKPKPIKIAERFRFYKRQQQQAETMAEYVAELRRLATTCEFAAFLDEALLDKFVCGMRKESIQRKLLSEADLTLTKALEIAQGMEAAEKDAKEIQATPVEQPQVHAIPQQQKLPCHRCLGTGHTADRCRFRTLRCNKCRKVGHIARACKTPAAPSQPQPSFRQSHSQGQGSRGRGRGRPTRAHQVEVSEEAQQDVADIVRVHAVSPSAPKSYKVSLEVNKIPITMELDTGASVSLVSEATWSDKLSKPQLQPCSLSLQSYPNRSLKVLGQCQVEVYVHGKTAQLPLIVVEGSGTPLFGRNWLEQIQLDWVEIIKINAITSQTSQSPQGLQTLLTKYKQVFQEELGQCKGVKAHLHVKAEATPKFFRPRPIPLSMKEKVEADLDRKEKQGILEKIEVSDWAAPIVPVSKPDGTVRVCGDYKVTINSYLDVNQYPLPRSEELFAALNGGVQFTKLDLSEAYLQIELDEDSKKFLVVNTHKGLYRVNRLPYGVASAPAIFQQTMDQLLPKLPGIVCFIDDILITGRTEKEHLSNLEAVLETLHKHGLRLKLRKCEFFKDSVEYLGQIVSKEGIHPSKKKIEAILNVQPPSDVSELRSFLGMVNHYGKFIQFLSDLSAPLNRLLRKDVPWRWSRECQHSFLEIKEALTSTKVLAHYDSKLPIGLACDASAVGVGAVLFHRYKDGTERPVAYASKSLTTAEKNYSQIEREALSIIYGVKKFHQYLYGRNFLLLTDHKPLLTIFGEKKGIPVMAASRLQRWAIILAAYSYTIEYIPTKEHGNADCLSRLPGENDPIFEKYHSQNSVVNQIQESRLSSLPISAEEVRQATENDDILKEVLRKMKHGWPKSRKAVSVELKPYFDRRFQLSSQSGCILCDQRVVIPARLREQILAEIHDGHCGIVRMKAVARMHVWWPSIDREIESCVYECSDCQRNSRNPVKAPVHPWEQPGKPWKRLHVDFAGPFCNSMWLIVVDAQSKWPEVIQMTSTTANRTVEVLRSLFSRFGIPQQLVSDNGPQFVSEEYKQFCEQNGIRRILVAPYHPSSNGEAERFVQTFKAAMRKADPKKIQLSLTQFLLRYRTTPHPATGKTPAELIFGRQIRTRLDLLHPSQKEACLKARKEEKLRQLSPGEAVWMRNYRGTDKWIPGVVMSKSGPLSYRICANDQIHRRHIDQLKKRGKQDSDRNDNDFVEFTSRQSPVTPELPDLPAEVDDPETTVQSSPDFTPAETDGSESQEPEPVTTRRYEMRTSRSRPDWYCK